MLELSLSWLDVLMTKMSRIVVWLGTVSVALSFQALAQEKLPLQVLVGMNKPPYIQLDTSDGFELELLREIVQRMGYRAEFTHVPNKRIQTLLNQQIGDIATLQPMSVTEPGLLYSCPYVRYQNVVITLQSDDLTITKVKDLEKLSVLAFQNASELLGAEYHAMANHSFKYRETVEQSRQVESLQLKRVQALVMDVNIFNYHNEKTLPVQQVNIHPLFPASYYRASFRKPEYAKAFDQALKSMFTDEKYLLLQERYRLTTQSPVELACEGHH